MITTFLTLFHHGFKAFHSTESALLRVYNHLLFTTDTGDSAILMLLDLTAAFDTVDHTILISRLEHCVGIRGTALDWFKSYLSERCFSISLGDCVLSFAPLSCGVPPRLHSWAHSLSPLPSPPRTHFKKHMASPTICTQMISKFTCERLSNPWCQTLVSKWTMLFNLTSR